MKRDYILFIIYFYNKDIELSMMFLKNYMIKNHKLEYSDVDKLLQNKCYNILALLDSYFVHCSMKENMHMSSYDIFYKYNINMNLKQKIFEFYKDKMKEKYFNSMISKIHNIDCIVDGGNISHSNGGKCDYKYVDKFLI